ncbi:MAG TPA: hypothetical protein VLF67_01120, partial [Candidatus Saccharimonas sp.]|nr:hypothetical protein [Candidatus Saccharimonas sp.]
MKPSPQAGFAHLGILLVVGVLIVVVAIALVRQSSHPAATKPSPSASASPAAIGVLKGFSLSPRSSAAADFTGFFAQASSAGAGAVTWAGDWNELGSASGAAHTVAALGKQYHYEPVIEVTAFRDSGGSLVPIRPLTTAQISTYAQQAASFAATNHLKYLGLGIEVNRIYATSPASFNTFVDLFNQSAAAIKAASPSTQVFTTFQLEQLRGLTGGLSGAKSVTPQWGLLDRFAAADFLAFTTYPSVYFHHPGDVPASYYADITAHTIKPVAFSEIGWPSQTPAAGWTATPQEQAGFITLFGQLTTSLNPTFIIWSFLYDPAAKQP